MGLQRVGHNWAASTFTSQDAYKSGREDRDRNRKLQTMQVHGGFTLGAHSGGWRCLWGGVCVQRGLHEGTWREGGGKNSQHRKAWWQSGDPNGASRNLKGLGGGGREGIWGLGSGVGRGPEKRTSTYMASPLLAWLALGLEGRSEVAGKRASAAMSGLEAPGTCEAEHGWVSLSARYPGGSSAHQLLFRTWTNLGLWTGRWAPPKAEAAPDPGASSSPRPSRDGLCFTCEEMKAQMWSDLLRARQPAESRARAGPGSRSCQVKGWH